MELQPPTTTTKTIYFGTIHFSLSLFFNKSKWWDSCINDSFCEFHASNKHILIMSTNVRNSFGHTWAISVVYTCKLFGSSLFKQTSNLLGITKINTNYSFYFCFFSPFIDCFKKKFNLNVIVQIAKNGKFHGIC